VPRAASTTTPTTSDPGGLALPEPVERLRYHAALAASRALAPAAAASAAAGRLLPDALAAVDDLSLAELDLPPELGGAGLGALAKVTVLEALAVGDAGGLPAADQPGPAVGALLACPDPRLAAEVAAACLAGEASTALLVLDTELGDRVRVEWAPAWPPLRWAWVNVGDQLVCLEVTTRPSPTTALAFAASGAVAVALGGCPVVGRWDLPDGRGAQVRGRARLWAAAVAVGVAQAAIDDALDGHAGGDRLLALSADVHGARLAVRSAAASADHDAPDAGYWATQAWLLAVGVAADATRTGVALHGADARFDDHAAARRLREARMLALLAGGRDPAQADVSDAVLHVGDPLFPTPPAPGTT
jgi:alkylation response protein AidB-like acyl-CoA dehydrogenase